MRPHQPSVARRRSLREQLSAERFQDAGDTTRQVDIGQLASSRDPAGKGKHSGPVPEPHVRWDRSVAQGHAVAQRLAFAAESETSHVWVSVTLSVLLGIVAPALHLLSWRSAGCFLLGTIAANLSAIYLAYRTRRLWRAAFLALPKENHEVSERND